PRKVICISGARPAARIQWIDGGYPPGIIYRLFELTEFAGSLRSDEQCINVFGRRSQRTFHGSLGPQEITVSIQSNSPKPSMSLGQIGIEVKGSIEHLFSSLVIGVQRAPSVT